MKKFNTLEEKGKEIKIIEYCQPYLDQMWAATICGIVLGCDFRDSKVEVEKFLKENT